MELITSEATFDILHFNWHNKKRMQVMHYSILKGYHDSIDMLSLLCMCLTDNTCTALAFWQLHSRDWKCTFYPAQAETSQCNSKMTLIFKWLSPHSHFYKSTPMNHINSKFLDHYIATAEIVWPTKHFYSNKQGVNIQISINDKKSLCFRK